MNDWLLSIGLVVSYILAALSCSWAIIQPEPLFVGVGIFGYVVMFVFGIVIIAGSGWDGNYQY